MNSRVHLSAKISVWQETDLSKLVMIIVKKDDGWGICRRFQTNDSNIKRIKHGFPAIDVISRKSIWKIFSFTLVGRFSDYVQVYKVTLKLIILLLLKN